MADPRKLKSIAERLEAFAEAEGDDNLLAVIGLEELRYLCVIAELLIELGACKLLKDLEDDA